ncbi:MAG: DedA family protein [Chloroflexi bacterium]|nr:MAG: DedA family protein [Chloroflexota bacterium]
MGVPFPGETMLITAAVYAGATHNLDITVIIVAAAGGAIAGDNVGFAIGWWGGYPLLRRFGRYIRLDEPRLKVGRYIFMRHGGKVVFFGRFVSVLRAYAAFLAGTNRMRWWRFLIFNAAGGICWAAIYGSAAYLLGQFEHLSRPLQIGFGVVGGAVIVASLLVIRSQAKRLEAAAEAALPGPLERFDA